MPRNRNNFIRTGDRYELFYATAAGWESLGEQVAESDSLVYKVPRGALLYLRDHTRGSDGRIFEMMDGRQNLWYLKKNGTKNVYFKRILHWMKYM